MAFAPPSPLGLRGLADTYPESDAPSADDLLSDGGTSARADSDAANDAFDAAAASLSLAADAADVFVRGRLVEAGILALPRCH